MKQKCVWPNCEKNAKDKDVDKCIIHINCDITKINDYINCKSCRKYAYQPNKLIKTCEICSNKYKDKNKDKNICKAIRQDNTQCITICYNNTNYCYKHQTYGNVQKLINDKKIQKEIKENKETTQNIKIDNNKKENIIIQNKNIKKEEYKLKLRPQSNIPENVIYKIDGKNTDKERKYYMYEKAFYDSKQNKHRIQKKSSTSNNKTDDEKLIQITNYVNKLYDEINKLDPNSNDYIDNIKIISEIATTFM